MRLKKFIILILAIFTFNKCADFLEERLVNVIVMDEYFQHRYEAVLFLYSGLQNLRTVFSGVNFLHVFEAPSDQTYFAGQAFASREISILNPQNNATHIGNVWQHLYQAVGRMNTLIHFLHTHPTFEGGGDLAERIEAQARVLRAFAYFQLVQLWGPVPITTVTLDTSGDLFPYRSPVADVHQFIIDDLLFGLEGVNADGETHLRDFDIDSSGQKVFPDVVYIRFGGDGIPLWLPFSRSAAELLLAQVYMVRNQGNDHQLAEEIVTAMIANELHQLLPNYEDLFQSDRQRTPNRAREVLFELEFSIEHGILNGTHREVAPNATDRMKPATIPVFRVNEVTRMPEWVNVSTPNNQLYLSGTASGFGSWIPTEHFLESFDQMRDRRYFWLYQFVGGQSSLTKPSDAPNFRKGHDHLGATAEGAAPAVLLRYAQAYLIKAELRARDGDGPGVAAALNPILARAGLDPFDPTGMDTQQLIDAVIDERAREFAHEAGDRLFTMRRVGFRRELERGFTYWHNRMDAILGGSAVIPWPFINPHARGNLFIRMMPNPAFRLEWEPFTHWDEQNPTAPNPAFAPPAPGHPDYEAFTFYDPGTYPAVEHYRQDQGVGGDVFLRNVPFLGGTAVPFRKEYRSVGNYSRANFHPIPIREVRVNPSLSNNMHIPNFN